MPAVFALLAAVGAPDRHRPLTPPVEVIRVWTYDEELYHFTLLELLLTRGPVVGAWPQPQHVGRSSHYWSRPWWDLERRVFRLVVRHGPDLFDRGPDPFDHSPRPRPDFEVVEGRDVVELRVAPTEPAAAAFDRLNTLVSPELPARPPLDGHANSLPQAAWDVADLIDVAVAATRAATPGEREDVIRATRDHPRPTVREYSRWLQRSADGATRFEEVVRATRAARQPRFSRSFRDED